MDITFTLANEDKAEEILDMMSDFYAIDQYHFDRTIGKKNILQFLENEQLGRFWIIQSNKKSIGYFVLTFVFSFEYKGNTAFLDELYLKEEYRSKGIGGKVMDFIDRQAKELQLKALHLEVERHNAKGNRLYKKYGFEKKNRDLLLKKVE